eukprot:TRINITY_DN878_c0_g1_i1.p1 TRINITY_DN878_c0_g1~~TRINITY_DN878_c0_g1_i1.p1  ORF type:complete len:595 (-),score=111.42 TRINITY_DN878_c0_g1_i1:311-2095(-)
MVNPLDDSQLLRLAGDLRYRLFPPLRGATVVGPLVVLTGLIPALAAVMGSEFDDVIAGWGLRALDVTRAVEIQDWLEPGRGGLAKGYLQQPPLSSWLLAFLVPRMGTDALATWRAMPLTAICCAIWMMYLIGRRIGGAAFGLITVWAICGHPVLLHLAPNPGPAALGVLLLALTVWGFLGHLEGPPQLVSMRMLCGAVAWGLALLAVGPAAVILFIPMLLHAWLLQGGQNAVAAATPGSRLKQLWLGLRTLIVFVLTALSFSGWWQLMMLTNYGSDFWFSWWTGHVRLNAVLETPHSCWRDWLSQNSFLVGWLVLGLISVIRELRKPTSEVGRRRCQFVLTWWLTALLMRLLFDIPSLRRSVLIDTWDAFLLLPTALLVAWGIRATIARQTTLLSESLLVVSTIALTAWRLTQRPWFGVTVFALAFLTIILLPTLMVRIRQGARRWTERDWKWVMQAAVCLMFVGHLCWGVLELTPPSSQSLALTELRKRIDPINPLPRVTLLTSNGNAPESLLFVLASRWPESQFLVANARDRRPIQEVAVDPRDEELVLEWTRQEVRIANEIPPDREATAVGDPLRLSGRRLTIYQIGPRQH